jgi:hypothetical protein
VFFLQFLLDDRRIRIRIHMIISLTDGSGCGSGRSQKHMDPPDPDPQQWPQPCLELFRWIITIREGCSHPFQLGGPVRVVGIIDGEGRAQLQNLPQHQVQFCRGYLFR